MSIDDLADRLEPLVHRETQVHDGGVDLTVASVHALTDPAQVDFGGGELTVATTNELAPAKRASDDDYGWWALDDGTYLLAYNESLSGDTSVHLQPRRELVERGCSHPTLRVADFPRVPLTVPASGVHLKENARVSTLRPLE